MKRNTLFLFLDLVIVSLSFLLVVGIKTASNSADILDYYKPFLYFLTVWVFTSLITRKYQFSKFRNLKSIAAIILISNFSVVAVISVLMFLLDQFTYSRILVFGTVIIATAIEIIGATIMNAAIRTPVVEFENGVFKKTKTGKDYKRKNQDGKDVGRFYNDQKHGAISPALLKVIQEEQGEEVKNLIERFLPQINGPVKVVSTTTIFNILALSQKSYGCIINLQRINDIKYINKYFEAVNTKIRSEGIFIGKAETFSLRKKQILNKYFVPLNYLIYAIDFVFKRLFPKVPGLKTLYFWFTGGKNRLVSRAETLGRLYSCGFEVLEETFINDELFFVVKKLGKPHFPKSPTYGPLIKLNRVGKNGKLFRVYKMRTMHPFAEYLQPYIYKKSSLQEGGKFKDDFRVSTLGRIMRKVWIDELPMLINLAQGNMKIVGVRPLSAHYFSLYTKELQEKRIKCKPGLIPPFYADMPETLEEIMESELRYLAEYEKKPIKTDLKYFFIAWNNILFKRARSN